MVIGLLTVQCHLPESASLKEKRRIIKSLLDRIKHRWNVSCAEIDGQDLWQRATLGIVCINTEQSFADQALSRAAEYIQQDPSVTVLDVQVEFLR